MPPLLTCHALCKSFKDGEKSIDVLQNVNFSVNAGEQVAILGSSGSGKSTLLHILGALDTPTSGSIEINGNALFDMNSQQQADFRNHTMGFVYQFHHLLPEFSALENVAMPLLIAGINPKQAEEKATSMLDRVGLSHRLKHQPAKLSGGERQRVAIARALVNEPQLVLADEPTGNLDKATGETIAELLTELRASLDTAFVVVTHDNAFAEQFDRILSLSAGHLEEVR
ncbi:lipoprotein-releasing ABC transporter ATP-binding protein LolD [Alteromonas facilis]|uniref:lipoprotein-releasing ABC transporter ATP-binding protein LolD n=1 Tax=Alteromonas facilis TaxID=2048004 RepID=UPI000C281F90|nr:lipoprotein-releasing ABC transporter ATP-binding protein LolD [Alteromonas facilis]